MYPETQSGISLNMFIKIPQNYSNKKKHFINHVEDHTSENFQELKANQVTIEPFDSNKHKNLSDVDYPQTEPDIVLDARQSPYKVKQILFLDQKTGHPGTGKNKILSHISIKRYCTTLNQFILEYQKTNKITLEILELIKDLKTSCHDLPTHQIFWAKGLSLFDKLGGVPPIKVPQNYCMRIFTPETLAAIEKEGFKLKRISDRLFLLKVPQNKTGTFSDEALALWDDSEIQRILAE